MGQHTASNDLLTALRSEVLGTTSFHMAYRLSFDRQKKAKARALWQLEAQTLERIEAYFEHQGLQRPALRGLQLGGYLAGLIFPLLPWRSILATTLKETAHYLSVFRRLAAEAAPEDRPLFDYVVAHEEAIARFAELELEGQPEQSLGAVVALLEGERAAGPWPD